MAVHGAQGGSNAKSVHTTTRQNLPLDTSGTSRKQRGYGMAGMPESMSPTNLRIGVKKMTPDIGSILGPHNSKGKVHPSLKPHGSGRHFPAPKPDF